MCVCVCVRACVCLLGQNILEYAHICEYVIIPHILAYVHTQTSSSIFCILAFVRVCVCVCVCVCVTCIAYSSMSTYKRT